MDYIHLRTIIQSYNIFSNKEKEMLLIKINWIEKYEKMILAAMKQGTLTKKNFQKMTQYVINQYIKDWKNANIPKTIWETFQNIHMTNAKLFIDVVLLHIRNGTFSKKLFTTMLEWIMYKSIENFMFTIITKGTK